MKMTDFIDTAFKDFIQTFNNVCHKDLSLKISKLGITIHMTFLTLHVTLHQKIG